MKLKKLVNERGKNPAQYSEGFGLFDSQGVKL